MPKSSSVTILYRNTVARYDISGAQLLRSGFTEH